MTLIFEYIFRFFPNIQLLSKPIKIVKSIYLNTNYKRVENKLNCNKNE